MSAPDRCRATSRSARPRCPLLQVTTTSGDMKVAGRLAGAGPFTIETVSGDGLLAPAGDVRVEMTSLTGDLASELDGRPRSPSEAGARWWSGADGPLVTFRSMSGDLSVVRATPVRAAEPPRPPAAPPPRRLPNRPMPRRPPTAPSPPPTTRRGCASSARSNAARSTSPRPGDASRRSTPATSAWPARRPGSTARRRDDRLGEGRPNG